MEENKFYFNQIREIFPRKYQNLVNFVLSNRKENFLIILLVVSMKIYLIKIMILYLLMVQLNEKKSFQKKHLTQI